MSHWLNNIHIKLPQQESENYGIQLKYTRDGKGMKQFACERILRWSTHSNILCACKVTREKLLDHIVSNQHKNLKVGRPTICYTRFECLVFLGLYRTILPWVGPPDPKAANGLFSVRQSLSKRGVYLIIESQIDENDRGITETNS